VKSPRRAKSFRLDSGLFFFVWLYSGFSLRLSEFGSAFLLTSSLFWLVY